MFGSSRLSWTEAAVICWLASLSGCTDVSCPVGSSEVNGQCSMQGEMAGAQAAASGASAVDGVAAPGSGDTSTPAAPSAGSSSERSRAGASAGASSVDDPATAMVDASAAKSGTRDAGSDSASDTEESSDAGAMMSGAQASDPSATPSICQAMPDGFVCDGAVLHTCDAAGESAAQETCMTESLCQLGMAHGACAQCEPGSFRCDEANLVSCVDGQLQLAEVCPSAALCQEAAGQCTEMVCKPNEKSCSSDGTLKTCSADGSAFASEESCGRGLCDASAGRCNACVKNAARCEGNTVMKCTASGDSETAMPCTAPPDGCSTSACMGGSCVAGHKREGESCPGSRKCSATGSCVACLKDSDCRGSNEMCKDTECVENPCGDGTIDSSKGETCDPGNSAYANAGEHCRNCKIPSTIFQERCDPKRAGQAVWSGSDEAGWICSGQGAISRLCSSSSDCLGTGATCQNYADGNGNVVLRSCAHECTTTSTDPWTPGGSGCPGGMSCYFVPGQSGRGTCGWSLDESRR